MLIFQTNFFLFFPYTEKGISRMERYERALKLGLNPDPIIPKLIDMLEEKKILKESNK